MKKDPLHSKNFLNKLYTNSELIFWTASLLYLFFLPFAEGPSLCFFSLIGITFCPGCGIGHAIHDAFHFRFSESFRHHYFGIPALLVIIYRIKELSFKAKTKTAQHEQ